MFNSLGCKSKIIKLRITFPQNLDKHFCLDGFEIIANSVSKLLSFSLQLTKFTCYSFRKNALRSQMRDFTLETRVTAFRGK